MRIETKKRLKVDYASVITEFEKAMKEFKVKKVLYKIVFRGRGLEFDGYRNFEPDDDASEIDWKSSLRMNKYLVKKYIEERNLNIYFVVDVSNGMLFGSGNKLKAERAGEVIAAMSHLSLGSDDMPSLVMFTDRVVKFVPPSKSINQFPLMIEFLSDANFYGGGFSFPFIIDYLLKIIKSPYSVVIILSDFIHLHHDSEKLLRLLSAKFETIAVMVRDRMDESIPKELDQIVLQDPYSERNLLVDPSIAAVRYNLIAKKQKQEVKDLLKRSNVDLLELNPDDSFVIPLVSFLSRRSGRKRVL